MEYTGKLEWKNQHLLKASHQLKKFGITYLSYGLVSQKTLINSVFSHKEWGLHYKKNHYENKDPLMQGVLNSNLSLIIWGALHPFGEEKKVMAERNEICGITSGLTIGIKNKSETETEIIALGATISTQEFYALLNDENHFKRVHHIIREFYFAQKQNLKQNREPIPIMQPHNHNLPASRLN